MYRDRLHFRDFLSFKDMFSICTHLTCHSYETDLASAPWTRAEARPQVGWTRGSFDLQDDAVKGKKYCDRTLIVISDINGFS